MKSENTTVVKNGKKVDTFKMEAGMDLFKRFEYGVPPKSIGDYAFIQHMLKSLADDGRMAVVLPHGALFRGASEGLIRKGILEDNLNRCSNWITRKLNLWCFNSSNNSTIQKEQKE